MLLKNQFFIVDGNFLAFVAGFFSFSKNADAAMPEVIRAEEVLLASDETNPLLVTGYSMYGFTCTGINIDRSFAEKSPV